MSPRTRLDYADLDVLGGEGDLDLGVNNLGSIAGIYRNDSPPPPPTLKTAPETLKIGVQVLACNADLTPEQKTCSPAGRRTSSKPPKHALTPAAQVLRTVERKALNTFRRPSSIAATAALGRRPNLTYVIYVSIPPSACCNKFSLAY